MHVHMYTSGTVPYVPTSPPSTEEHTSAQDELERENRAYYYIQPVPRTRIGGSPRTRGPAPNPQPSPHTHTVTHTHTPTRGNKSLIPLSTFHFLYLSTGTYRLPGTSMYCILSTVVKKIQNTLGPYITTLPYLHLPPLIIDHHLYRQYVRKFAQLPCRDDIPSCKSVHHLHHHQTRIRVRRGVPFPTMYM